MTKNLDNLLTKIPILFALLYLLLPFLGSGKDLFIFFEQSFHYVNLPWFNIFPMSVLDKMFFLMKIGPVISALIVSYIFYSYKTTRNEKIGYILAVIVATPMSSWIVSINFGWLESSLANWASHLGCSLFMIFFISRDKPIAKYLSFLSIVFWPPNIFIFFVLWGYKYIPFKKIYYLHIVIALLGLYFGDIYLFLKPYDSFLYSFFLIVGLLCIIFIVDKKKAPFYLFIISVTFFVWDLSSFLSILCLCYICFEKINMSALIRVWRVLAYSSFVFAIFIQVLFLFLSYSFMDRPVKYFHSYTNYAPVFDSRIGVIFDDMETSVKKAKIVVNDIRKAKSVLSPDSITVIKDQEYIVNNFKRDSYNIFNINVIKLVKPTTTIMSFNDITEDMTEVWTPNCSRDWPPCKSTDKEFFEKIQKSWKEEKINLFSRWVRLESKNHD